MWWRAALSRGWRQSSIYVRGTNGKLCEKRYNPNGTWSRWTNHGALLSGAPAGTTWRQ